MRNNTLKTTLIFLFLLTASSQINAQSTLWNIPSTDIQADKTTYVEADFFAHLSGYEKGGFQTYGARAVRGIGKKLEVGFNAFVTKTGDTAQPIEIQPNAKWGIYENEKYGVKASVGAILYIPVNHRRGTDTFGMIYSTISKKFKGEYAPRLTTGGYGLFARQKGQGSKSGFLAAYEQPLGGKVSFVADWYSGKNRFGYAGGGLAFTMSKKSALFIGYNVGNSGHRNNYLSVFYGRTF